MKQIKNIKVEDISRLYAAPLNSTTHRTKLGQAAVKGAWAMALTLALVSDNAALGADVKHVGYQYGGSALFPESGSFFNGGIWLNYLVPTTNDTAILGAKWDMGNGNTTHSPHTLHFGSFNFDVPGQSPQVFPAGNATMNQMWFYNGDWTLDFGSGATPGAVVPAPSTGSCVVAEVIVVGAQDPANPTLGNATLTIRHGTLTQTLECCWNGMNAGEGGGCVGAVVVDGPDAGVNIARAVWIGNGGGTGYVTVTNGASFMAAGFLNGFYAGPNGELPTGHVLVTGAGSRVRTFGGMNNGTVRIEKGGFASVLGRDGQPQYSFIGAGDGTLASVTVTDPGSQWTGTARLTVGGVYHTDTTGHGVLNILNGAFVDSQVASIANRSRSRGEVLVSGNGSIWTNSGWMVVGDDGQGSMVVEHNGAALTDVLTVGSTENGRGQLSVLTGGRVSCRAGLIGETMGARGQSLFPALVPL